MRPCPQCGTPLENQIKVCPRCHAVTTEHRPEVQLQPDGPGVSGPAEDESFRTQLAFLSVSVGLIVGGIAVYYWGVIGITLGVMAAAAAFVGRLMLQKSY